jgi:hypothetical protein
MIVIQYAVEQKKKKLKKYFIISKCTRSKQKKIARYNMAGTILGCKDTVLGKVLISWNQILGQEKD